MRLDSERQTPERSPLASGGKTFLLSTSLPFFQVHRLSKNFKGFSESIASVVQGCDHQCAFL